MLRTIVIILSLATANSATAETLIPRSAPGDKGRYYLLEVKRTGDLVKALHKRVGVDSVGFTRTETNCKTRQIREFGYSEGAPPANTAPTTGWYELVPGSSKSDLAEFVCKR